MTKDIKVGETYTAPAWTAPRKVSQIVAVPGKSTIVHYVNTGTHRTGNCPLETFTSKATLMTDI